VISNNRLGPGKILLLSILFACARVSAQQNLSQAGQPQSANATEALQKATQNPVANLISVPLQDNTNLGIGPFDRNQNALNIQPVIPIHMTSNWNLIIRWITPIIWQPAPGTANLEVYGIVENTPAYFAAQDVQKSAGVYGLGDMTPTFFFSPANPHKVIWGAGPVFVVPTATRKTQHGCCPGAAWALDLDAATTYRTAPRSIVSSGARGVQTQLSAAQQVLGLSKKSRIARMF
jgi:hypothetical protein